jgi:ubiquinone/menaquinone biosynthesis C-methylase UbiE
MSEEGFPKPPAASPDAFQRLVIAEFQRAAREKEEYTVPWLELDIQGIRAYREGRLGALPGPYAADPVAQQMFAGAPGLDVLCLAGGGGQQSAIYGLLGARVTVFDLMEEQLAGDRAAAAHYGYSITTVQGDMRDLSVFAPESFDRVFQPISTLYTPDLPAVYAGVARVLRPGGLYYADFTFPLLYLAQVLGWDGTGYLLRVREPYRRGEIREWVEPGEDPAVRQDTPDLPKTKKVSRMIASFTEGEPIGEYHHLLSDIINGLIAAGLSIRCVWENPRPDAPGAPSAPVLPGEPGSPAHHDTFLPFGLSVMAQKPLRDNVQ